MLDHRLTVLRTFAACGSVTAAAEALDYSPSAVSAQLRGLQADLGLRLVEKDGRGLRLTPAGRRLVEESDGLFTHWEGVRAALAADGGAEAEQLRLGGMSTATAALLAPVAVRLRAEAPGLGISIVEADPQRCFDLLLADRLDLAIVVSMQASAGAGDPRYERIALLDDPLDIMLPADHRLAGRESISLEEVGEEPWIAARPGTPYRALFIAAFTAAGTTPRVAHEVAEWDTEATLIEKGLGIGLVPRLARISSDYRVVRVPVAGPAAPHRRVVAAIRRGARERPLIARTVDALREQARDGLGYR